LSALKINNRIELIQSDYATYVGALHNKADVVVAVAPNPGAPIVAGIKNFIRAGGMVLVLTDQESVKNELTQTFGKKALVRRVSFTGRSGDLEVVADTSLGVPLASHYYDIAPNYQPWEIYIPSW
jgi:hypothetical protein